MTTRLAVNVKKVHAPLLCAFALSTAKIPQLLAQNPTDGRIDRVLHGLRPPVGIEGRPAVRWTMAERMAVHHVPGASVAIIDDGRVVWAGGFGLQEAGTSHSVTASTRSEERRVGKECRSRWSPYH